MPSAGQSEPSLAIDPAPVARGAGPSRAAGTLVSLDDLSRERLRRLNEIYHNQGITLILGAGVSMSEGIGRPSWEALLSDLIVEDLAEHMGIEPSDPETTRALSRIYRAALEERNPIVLARYVREHCRRRPDHPANPHGLHEVEAKFKELIRAALYQGIEGVRSLESPLLEAIYELVNNRGNAIRVRGIITYNLDDVVEEHWWLHNREINRVDKSEGGDGLPDSDAIKIRHVHGFLGRPDSARGGRPGGGREWVIFSEEEYHKQYAEPYSWSNIVQLSAFRSTRCLFVGSSLKDPNLRRLLELARYKEDSSSAVVAARHFALLRRTDPRDLTTSSEPLDPAALQQFGDRICADICATADEAKDMAFQELGVNVIWYTHHSEVPRILTEIRMHHPVGPKRRTRRP